MIPDLRRLSRAQKKCYKKQSIIYQKLLNGIFPWKLDSVEVFCVCIKLNWQL